MGDTDRVVTDYSPSRQLFNGLAIAFVIWSAVALKGGTPLEELPTWWATQLGRIWDGLAATELGTAIGHGLRSLLG